MTTMAAWAMPAVLVPSDFSSDPDSFPEIAVPIRSLPGSHLRGAVSVSRLSQYDRALDPLAQVNGSSGRKYGF